MVKVESRKEVIRGKFQACALLCFIIYLFFAVFPYHFMFFQLEGCLCNINGHSLICLTEYYHGTKFKGT